MTTYIMTSSCTNRKVADRHGTTAQTSPSTTTTKKNYKKLSCSGGGRPQRHLTVRDLKKLRKKSMAVVSQQVLSIRNLLQIPEDDEALFNDPPLDHVIEDIYNDIDREDDNCNDNDDTGSDDVIFEDNSSSDTGESFHTTATANSSDTGQDHEVVVSNISSIPTQSRRTRGNGPVDLDDSVDDASTAVTVDNESVMTGTTNTTSGGPVDMDIIHENDENFDAIWKEHEDEFLVWKAGAQHTKMAASTKMNDSNAKVVNELYNHPTADSDNELDNDAVSLVTSSSLDTFGFPSENRATVVVVAAGTGTVGVSPLPKTIDNPSAAEYDASEDAKSVATCSSLDTFGFPIDRAAAVLLNATTNFPSHNGAPISARWEQQQQESRPKTSALSLPSPPQVAPHEQQQQQQHQQQQQNHPIYSYHVERSGKCSSNNTDEPCSPASKARRLRALRLRAAINDPDRANNAINFGHQECPPVEEEKESSENPGQCGHVIQVRNNTRNGGECQSVVSEITNLSDKLFLKVNSKPESKWDDMSSIGFSIEQGRTATPAYKVNVDDHAIMEAMEQQGRDVEEPPFYFDGSVKTPPICYMDPKIKAQLEQHQHQHKEKQKNSNDCQDPYSGESKWDDVSSIGLMGVETINRGPKLTLPQTRTTSENNNNNNNNAPVPMIPFVIRPRVEDSDNTSSEEDNNNSNISDIFRRRSSADSNNNDEEQSIASEATPAFSTLWGEDHTNTKKGKPKKSSSDTPDLELNPTFSTVWVEDCDSYSNSSVDLNDLEMQADQRKYKVSSTAGASDSDDDSEKIQRSALTKLHWVIVTVSLVVIVAAIAGVALYVSVVA